VYSFNLGTVGGQASAYVFFSLFNPVDSDTELVLRRVRVTPFSAGTATANNTALLSRITDASGGTLTYNPENPSATAINKLQTIYADSVSEIRTVNPTITAAAVICRFSPPIQGDTVSAYSANDQFIDFPEGSLGRFILAPGEGVAFRQAAAGDTDHRWPCMIEWAEQPVASMDES
jgi:hypothetical protein